MHGGRFERRATGAQRVMLAVAVLLVGLVWNRGGLDVFHMPKLVMLLIATGLLVGVAGARLVATRVVWVPTGPVVVTALGVLVAGSVVTLASDVVAISVWGAHGRSIGWLLLLAGVVGFLVVLRSFAPRHIRLLQYAIGAATAVVAGYAVVQFARVDPLVWEATSGGIVGSTLGNPNFVAAYTAIGGLVAVSLVVDAELADSSRWLAAAVAALAVASTVLAGSLQGPVALVAGVIPLAWVLARRRWGARVVDTTFGAGGAVGVALVAAGIASVGPLAALGAQESVRLRTYYWDAALGMFANDPLVGVGLGRYDAWYHANRPLEAARQLPLGSTVDSAHNVVLDVLAQGGLLMALPYLAFVGLVGWTLLRALRDPGSSMSLAALGGAWLAYQTQSMVSIDVPALSFTHWVLAGAVLVAAGGVRLREVGLARGARQRWKARVPGGRAALAVALGAAILVAAAILPLRMLVADSAAADSRILRDGDRADLAVVAADRAIGLAPHQPEYWRLRADALAAEGDEEQAAEGYRDVVRHDPRDLGATVTVARYEHVLGELPSAIEWYERALRLEPQSARLHAEFAAALNDAGHRQEAELRYRRVLELAPTSPFARALLTEILLEEDRPNEAAQLVRPLVDRVDDARLWTLLGRAEEGTGDLEAARAAYQRALEVDPDNAEARERLERLGSSG